MPKKTYETLNRLSDIGFSPQGEKITFSEMVDNDWEIFVVDTSGQNLKAVTSEIQHDRLGRFVTENLLLGIKGERRHQRSYLYNLDNGRNIRLLQNNTVRTISPEYEWAIHPGGQKILFVSERDGDTMSPERGVYLMDMENKISPEALLKRITANLASEKDLHKRGKRMFSSIFSQVEARADDNTSATAVTLEAARILKAHPQPATIIFALFTGEEAGLLGSREFVNQAVKNELKIVGALNNDMIGWCENNRMDNTIRYSNEKIRDIQHAASFLFSELITYDTRYIKSTDAAAYYEKFGDIVGGIGSYPVLGSPFYHQVTDRIETVNFHLIGEGAKSTIAALMCLASNPPPISESLLPEENR